MRRILWMAAMVACVTVLLAGCGLGLKNAETVVRDLDKAVTGLESYKGMGTMTLHTGNQPLEYRVEVWYQKPQYYRIALTNAKKDVTQIVLRNDDGVFVLTPSLGKSFRFQSDWPQNQGQVYLFQTLAQSILIDNSRKFTTDKESYVFDVMASSYQNGSLARQKIWLDKKTLAPQRVEVSDSNATVMVDVTFDSFSFGDKFQPGAFDTAVNMGKPKDDAGASSDSAGGGATPPSGEAGKAPSDGATGGGKDGGKDGGAAGEGAEAGDASGDASGGEAAADEGGAAGGEAGETDGEAAADGDEAAGGEAGAADGEAAAVEVGTDSGEAAGGEASADGGSADGGEAGAGQAAAGTDGDGGASDGAFAAMEPAYIPDGVALRDMEEITLGGSKGMMFRYAGDYDYSLIQTHPKDQAASLVRGDLVDLGFTVALLSGDEQRTLTWTYDGIEYRLTSGNLPDSEMVKVAQSIEAELGK